MPPLPHRPVSCLVLAALLGGGSVTAAAAPPQPSAKEIPPAAETKAQQQVQREASDNSPARDNAARGSSVHSDSHHNEDGLSDSIRRIERSTRGQVLSAERVPYQGRSLNRIKVVDAHGRVRVYMDDPQPKSTPVPDKLPTRRDDD